ncbi:MAG TPA: Shedu immune nuclease family protein [Thermoleophilaceae bacterium]|nr:Shedu immune nuclease family protein [Thermoleophilaceae bacterium]
MVNTRITTESVAANAVDTDPIVLRESDTRRLVFKPMIVDKSEAPVRGVFVWQRKLKAGTWGDLTGESLTTMKAGEGYSLELHSDEVNTLLNGVQARKEIYEQYGIQFGAQDFYAGAELPDVVQRILEEPDSELAKALRALDPESRVSLGRSVDVSKLDAFLDEWDANGENDDEGYWQDLLARNAWVFSQLTGSPVVLLQERAYVGGKGISNTGGGMVDYLLANTLTENVSLVEIKTPGASLCHAQYRSSGSYVLGKDLVGGVVQVLGYRDTFLNEIGSLRQGSDTYQAYNPQCYVVVGRIASLPDGDAKRSFELFRGAQSVHILAFDEVRARLQGIRDVLLADDGASAS